MTYSKDEVINPVDLVEYVDETICRIETTLMDHLVQSFGTLSETYREQAQAAAYEIYRLVRYFNLTLPLEVSSKIADLMTNRAFY